MSTAVLVTGGAGSMGKLISKHLRYDPEDPE